MLPHSAYESYINNKYVALDKISIEDALCKVKHELDAELLLEENNYAKIDLNTLYACKKALECQKYYEWHIMTSGFYDLPVEGLDSCNTIEIVTSKNDIGTIVYTYKHISIQDFLNHNEDIVSHDENIIAWRYIDWYPCIC